VHQRLRLRLADTQAQLDRVGRKFWSVTRFILRDRAQFDEAALAFDLLEPPTPQISTGRYHLISKMHPQSDLGADQFLYRLSHPLGEYVIDSAKALPTPPVRIAFDISSHPTRLHVVESLRGRGGYLTLTRLAIETYELEEYLLFSGFDDAGHTLDQETLGKLFLCTGRVLEDITIPDAVSARLAAESQRHVEATISRSLESNSKYFQQAREKLEAWADDMVLAAEKALRDTKEKIKALTREARQAATLDEQHRIQEEIARLEKLKRKQRQDIFQVEDEIMEKRDTLIAQLEKRLVQKTTTETLFTIRWEVI
jgi:hypothetical protein